MEKTADNDGDDERVVVSKTWQRLQNNWLQAGFREGASAGRDKTFQEGFDTGYAEGFSVGTKLGFIKGVLKLGVVAVKEASVVIAVSSAHRTEALEAVHYIIDTLKASVPIWKKEVYENEEATWKENKECPWKSN